MRKRKIPEAFHPGEYLREELEERDWNEYDLRSACFDLTLPEIREILECRHPITPHIAKEIGEALGTSAEVWLRLQTTYDLTKEIQAARRKR